MSCGEAREKIRKIHTKDASSSWNQGRLPLRTPLDAFSFFTSRILAKKGWKSASDLYFMAGSSRNNRGKGSSHRTQAYPSSSVCPAKSCSRLNILTLLSDTDLATHHLSQL